MGRLALVFLLVAGLMAAAPVALDPLGGPAPALAHPEPGDVDGDGVRDEDDNCPQARNGDQRDGDGDGFGDRCDSDADGDGITNPLPYPTPRAPGDDNCPLVPNPGQEPAPENPTFGAACYVDSDGDGVPDPLDNCPAAANGDQADYDYDRTGDVCDPDDDEDGEFDGADNCRLVYNPLQEDADGDGIGTACDASEVAPGAPGGSTGGGSVADRTPPSIRVRIARTQRLRRVGRTLPVEVRCSEACAVEARLRRKGRRATLASGIATLGGRGTTYVFLRLARAVVRRAPMKAGLAIVATDAAGNATRARRALRLRR